MTMATMDVHAKLTTETSSWSHLSEEPKGKSGINGNDAVMGNGNSPALDSAEPVKSVTWRVDPPGRPSSSAGSSSSTTDEHRPPPPRHTSHPVKSFGIHVAEAGGPQSTAYATIRSYSDDPDTRKFPRISKPVELLRDSYDTVVIGSGYGGGVAASRMARAGHSVCLLERGQEKWPGE